MTTYEYLIQQKQKLVIAFQRTAKYWIAEKICEIQRKIDNLTISEAESDYRPARR
jgi:hypothetical protein